MSSPACLVKIGLQPSKYDHLDEDVLLRLLERRVANVSLAWYVIVTRSKRRKSEFMYLQKLGRKLENVGPVDVARLRR